MARKNRITVPDGIYHVTARAANGAMLFKSPEVKDKIVEWILGVARFSGVELFGWCVMDNHLHLFVRIPRVPERYWLDPQSEPAAYAFGMRPPECRVPLWSVPAPQVGDSPRPESPRPDAIVDARYGDSPRFPAADRSLDNGDSPRNNGDSPRVLQLVRPPVEFAMSDEEMLGRLVGLYGRGGAEEVAKRWRSRHALGLGKLVEEEKERYCRRMYNLSQFVKTLAEKIGRRYNADFGHRGCVWQGRFYSAAVEPTSCVQAIVAAYIGFNPVRAALVVRPEDWRWSSYAAACDETSPLCAAARTAYCKILACDWPEARARLEGIFADRLPEGLDAEALEDILRETGLDGDSPRSAEELVSDGDSPRSAEELVSDGDSPRAARESCSDGDSPRNGEAEREGVEVAAVPRTRLRVSQAIHVGLWFFTRGGYIGRDLAFGRSVVAKLPKRFPHLSFRSLDRCRALRWEMPWADPLAA